MSSTYYWDGVSEVPQDVVKVVINSGVESVPDFAFASRHFLESVKFPSSLTTIGNFAFVDCDSLSAVTIVSSVTTIGAGAFSCSSGLQTIRVSSGNASFSAQNGVLYDKNKTKLIQYPIGRTDEEFYVPYSVKYICDFAFQNCVYLKFVAFSDKTISVGNNAFDGCEKLGKVMFYDNLESVGNYAFYDCRPLKEVTIPNNTKSIGTKAFGYYPEDGKVSGFTVRGYNLSEAQRYAKQNGFTFYKIPEPIRVTSLEKDSSSKDASYNLDINKSLDLAVKVLPKNAEETCVIWESSNTAVVEIGNLRMDSSGKISVTVYPTWNQVEPAVGSDNMCHATVTATSLDGNFSVSWVIKVFIPTSSIELSDSALTVHAGKLLRMSAKVTPSNLTNHRIVWKSSNTSVAEIYQIYYTETTQGIRQEKVEPTATATSDGKGFTVVARDVDNDYLLSCAKIVPKSPGTAKITVESEATWDDAIGECTITVEKAKKTDPQIVIRGDANKLTAGSNYNVDIFLKNNPGIVGLNLRIKYDYNYLRISRIDTEKQEGKAIFDKEYHCNTQSRNPYPMSWASNTVTENIDFSGKVATAVFRLEQVPANNKMLPVYVFYDDENLDIYDVDLSPVDFVVTNSTIKVTNVEYGNVDSLDGVTDLDVMKLARYLSEWSGDSNQLHTTPQQGKSYTEIEAADLTSDSRITHRDQVILARYVDSKVIYTTKTDGSAKAGSEIKLPDDAIDKIAEGNVMPLYRITTVTETYTKLTSNDAPNGWSKNYKSYYTYDSETESYESVTGDTAPTYEKNKYYEKKEVTTILHEKDDGDHKTNYDYTVSSDGKTITFHESNVVPVDSEIEVTITYRIYSPWKGTDYEVIPFDE